MVRLDVSVRHEGLLVAGAVPRNPTPQPEAFVITPIYIVSSNDLA
jgi:hypothetical protein